MDRFYLRFQEWRRWWRGPDYPARAKACTAPTIFSRQGLRRIPGRTTWVWIRWSCRNNNELFRKFCRRDKNFFNTFMNYSNFCSILCFRLKSLYLHFNRIISLHDCTVTVNKYGKLRNGDSEGMNKKNIFKGMQKTNRNGGVYSNAVEVHYTLDRNFLYESPYKWSKVKVISSLACARRQDYRFYVLIRYW